MLFNNITEHIYLLSINVHLSITLIITKCWYIIPLNYFTFTRWRIRKDTKRQKKVKICISVIVYRSHSFNNNNQSDCEKEEHR